MKEHESSTKRELRLLRTLETYVEIAQYEMGHPARAIHIELLKIRQKRLLNKLQHQGA
jgi:hypothetical protein